jgi:hypothetical protein
MSSARTTTILIAAVSIIGLAWLWRTYYQLNRSNDV